MYKDASVDKRTYLGAVYTPRLISDYVSGLLVSLKKKKWIEEAEVLYPGFSGKSKVQRLTYRLQRLLDWTVVDPACGDSSLLVAIEEKLEKERKELLDLLEVNGAPWDSNKIKVFSDQPVTFGVDIDKEAVTQSRLRLKALHLKGTGRQSSILQADSLYPVSGLSRVEGWYRLFPNVLKKGGFGAVIANPPWGAEILNSRDVLNKTGYRLATGQFDSYELFIELCLELVAEGAPLAFIIPDSVFLPEHKRLREILLKESQIRLISRLGEKFFPGVNRSCVIILIEKRNPEPDCLTRCFRLNPDWRKMILSSEKSLDEASFALSHEVPQNRFLADPELRFDIDTRTEDTALLDRIRKEPMDWGKVLTSGRGVEISKKGKVIECPSCGVCQPFPRKSNPETICQTCGTVFLTNAAKIDLIVTREPVESQGWVPFVAGEDVHRYSIRPKHFLRLGVRGINYKRPEDFQGPKILVRKTGIGIHAALDTVGYYTTQTVFHYRLSEESKKNSRYSLGYILGVLNSRIMFYFYISKYGESEWRSHPYITQKVISQLPIPKLSNAERSSQAMAISELVNQMADSSTPDLIADLEIERLVAGLFGLSRRDCDRILECIEEAQQLQAVEALRLEKGSLYPLQYCKDP